MSLKLCFWLKSYDIHDPRIVFLKKIIWFCLVLKLNKMHLLYYAEILWEKSKEKSSSYLTETFSSNHCVAVTAHIARQENIVSKPSFVVSIAAFLHSFMLPKQLCMLAARREHWGSVCSHSLLIYLFCFRRCSDLIQLIST